MGFYDRYRSFHKDFAKRNNRIMANILSPIPLSLVKCLLINTAIGDFSA